MYNTSHFQGGTITYKILDIYGSTVSIMITQTYLYRWPLVYCDNTRILSQSTPNSSTFSEYNSTLNCVANCTTTGGYSPVPVRTFCTDYSSNMAISVTQRTDTVNLTSGAYFTVAFASSAWRTLSLPSPSSSSKGWSVACAIDLRVRSDTGKPNTPPVANMISPIYIPVGVQKALIIPTIDSDNDVVRCRFANSTLECDDVCPPASLPSNTILISSNCTLLITGATVNAWYAVAIQIEDFVNSTSTIPLSSVPVQFLINVYATPSCNIAPLLYGPHNKTGTCDSIQVGQAYSLTLYAVNYCSNYSVTIKDIATLSFPIVSKSSIIQNSSTLYSTTLTWTPTASQTGSQILCAVAIDSQNIQSNQYCVAFSVSSDSGGTCPGEVAQTTSYNSIAMTTTVYQTTSVTTMNDNMIITTEVSTLNPDDDFTTDIIDEQTSEADTTVITTTTTVITTTSSTSNTWPWLLPLIIALASLLTLLCCCFLCCPQPYGCGLLCRKCCQDKSLKPLHDIGPANQPARMYMISKIFGKNFDSNSQLGSTTESDIHLDLSSSASSHNMNRKIMINRWAYPSPRYYEIKISRAEHPFGGLYVRKHRNIINTTLSQD